HRTARSVVQRTTPHAGEGQVDTPHASNRYSQQGSRRQRLPRARSTPRLVGPGPGCLASKWSWRPPPSSRGITRPAGRARPRNGTPTVEVRAITGPERAIWRVEPSELDAGPANQGTRVRLTRRCGPTRGTHAEWVMRHPETVFRPQSPFQQQPGPAIGTG